MQTTLSTKDKPVKFSVNSGCTNISVNSEPFKTSVDLGPVNTSVNSGRAINSNQFFLHKFKLTHVSNLIININSVKSKFDQLKVVIGKNLDVLVLIETKIDSTFPTSQFEINGFSKQYKLDRNINGGGILIYIGEGIPSKLLTKHKLPYDIEGIFIELNFRKSKLLFGGLYHPPNQSNNYFYENIGNA